MLQSGKTPKVSITNYSNHCNETTSHFLSNMTGIDARAVESELENVAGCHKCILYKQFQSKHEAAHISNISILSFRF